MNKSWALAWPQAPLLSPVAWDRIGFALRLWLAAMLALDTSFAPQLESPYWALLQPERRAWARILGSLEEIDVYLAHHPRLTKAPDTA